ncbi:MAG: hypothetical protein Q4F21_00265 [Lachnospiraceae bacterium]|nr:hypothetical protein [Lachnospiraceae bacterium]
MKRSRYHSSCSSVRREERTEAEREAYEKMKGDLEAYTERGVVLKLSGRKTSSAYIANVCCIRECGSYMGDYVLDDSGKLVEICFDRVKNR